MFQKIKSFFHRMWTKVAGWAELIWNESWTRALAWFAGVPSSVLFALSYVNEIITDPTFKEYLGIVDVPRPVTLALATFSIFVWLAHGRKNG